MTLQFALGANLINLSDPELISRIYSIKGDFARSRGTDQHSENQRGYMNLFIGLKIRNGWVDDDQIASWLMINASRSVL